MAVELSIIKSMDQIELGITELHAKTGEMCGSFKSANPKFQVYPGVWYFMHDDGRANLVVGKFDDNGNVIELYDRYNSYYQSRDKRYYVPCIPDVPAAVKERYTNFRWSGSDETLPMFVLTDAENWHALYFTRLGQSYYHFRTDISQDDLVALDLCLQRRVEAVQLVIADPIKVKRD